MDLEEAKKVLVETLKKIDKEQLYKDLLSSGLLARKEIKMSSNKKHLKLQINPNWLEKNIKAFNEFYANSTHNWGDDIILTTQIRDFEILEDGEWEGVTE